jgi:hypothetical protein
VSVKVRAENAASDWYWFEDFDGEAFAAGTDVDVCTDCHGAANDFVWTGAPLN